MVFKQIKKIIIVITRCNMIFPLPDWGSGCWAFWIRICFQNMMGNLCQTHCVDITKFG